MEKSSIFEQKVKYADGRLHDSIKVDGKVLMVKFVGEKMNTFRLCLVFGYG